MTKNSTYSTLDIYCAAFLAYCGLRPTLINQNGKVIFTFTLSAELHEQLMHFNSNIEINVLDFITAIKILRGQMLAMRDMPRI